MRKLFLALVLITLTGCSSSPSFLERTSEALSRSVYATGDSLVLGRVELAKKFNDEAEKLVPPPKQRVSISPITSGTTKVVTLPSSYTGSIRTEEGSEVYNQLVSVKAEKQLLEDHVKEVELERQNQDEIHNKLLKEYVTAQVEIEKLGKVVAKKTITIIILSLVIAGILALIGLGIYLKALVPVRIW